MKRFIVLLIASLLAFGEPTFALANALGHERFMVGQDDPRLIAPLVLKSLKIDPKGNQVVDPAHCSPNGDGCVTPNDYLISYQHNDTAAGLTSVDQLYSYMMRMTPEKAVDSGQKYWMSCLTPAGNGKHKVIIECMARTIKKGETFYKSWTGVLAHAGWCANPIGRKDAPKDQCVYLLVSMKRRQELHATFAGPDAMPKGKCFAVRLPGETDWLTADLNKCPRVTCNFIEAGRFFGLRIHSETDGDTISFTADVDGIAVIRQDASVLKSRSAWILCLLEPWLKRQSESSLVTGVAYRMDEAYLVFPGETQHIPAGWPGLAHTWLFKGSKMQ